MAERKKRQKTEPMKPPVRLSRGWPPPPIEPEYTALSAAAPSSRLPLSSSSHHRTCPQPQCGPASYRL